METLEAAEYIRKHPLFKALKKDHLEFLVDHCEPCSYAQNECIFRQGEEANTFYIVLSGVVKLESPRDKGRPLEVQALGENDVLGWSWLVPPYRWEFDARAATPVEAIEFNATSVRARCEQDPAFGYASMRSVSEMMLDRLHTIRALMARKIAELEDDIYPDHVEEIRPSAGSESTGNDSWL